MAFSKVEIVSSSPFGCVLKDRNRRVRCRETNARGAAFGKNLKELVRGRDHFHNRITVSTDEDDENSKKHSHKNVDYWVAKEQGSNGNAREQWSNINDNKSNGKNYRAGDDCDDGYGSLVMSSIQSRISDKWAARQAREMASNIQKQSQEAELMVSSASASSSTSSSSSNPTKESLRNMQNPRVESDSDAVGNRGASSLVQMWEKRLNRSNSLNNSMNPVSISSRTSSGIGNKCSEASRDPEMGNSVHERDGSRANNEDSLADWEPQSGKSAQSEPPTRRNSDAVESERVRISDIIKRLTSASDDTNDHDAGTSHCESPSRERRHSPVTDQGEQGEQQRENKIFSRVICSPKIRGRQAFTDLLMQLERERHRELDSLGQRQGVSRFTHRGRIQAMLRLRFLHRGIAIQDQQSSQSVGSRSFNRLSHRSSIRHLREKYSPGAEHGAAAQNATTSRNPQMDNNTVYLEDSSSASGPREDNHLQEASTGRRKNTASKEKSVSQTIEYHQKEGDPKIDVTQKGISMGTTSVHQKEGSPKDDATQKGTNMETSFLDLQGTAEMSTYLNGRKGKSRVIAEDHDRKQEQHIHGKSQENSQPTASLDGQNVIEKADEQEANEQQQQQLCIHSQENAETTASLNDWDENELAEEEEEAYFLDQLRETSHDWISEISRPRSYWEDRRQTWYREMLNSSSEKEEIRQLLERRRVSTFLTSDFREKMDQLMTSRVERQTELEAYQEEEDEMSQERIGQLMLAHLQRQVHSAASQEGEQAEERGLVEQVNEPVVVQEEEEEQEPQHQQEDEEQEEKEDEEENPISPLFHEASDFDQSSPSVQLTSPSTIQTWSYHDVGDESDPVTSTSLSQPLPSQAYYQDSWQSSSSTIRISIERELIYDLRAQIEQLHREMSELRKSVHSCMEMKVKLHQCNQQEVHPVKGMEENNSLGGALKKRSCCICYEMQVDSLLYRCGHMCTCLKCAHELQWSSGKCPICRAPIDDVVRAFMDS